MSNRLPKFRIKENIRRAYSHAWKCLFLKRLSQYTANTAFKKQVRLIANKKWPHIENHHRKHHRGAQKQDKHHVNQRQNIQICCCYWFNVADGYADLGTSLAGINLKTACVIGVETDVLFPAYQQKEIADALRSNGIDTSFTNLESLMGHHAFLVDHAHFNPLVMAYFDRIWFEDKL